MCKPNRPVLRPLIIPPATTSSNIRDITVVHKPIRTSTAVAPKKDSNGSTHHTIPKTPQVVDSIPLTPLPTYSIARSKNLNRRYPNTGTPQTSGWTGQDVEHQAAARNILGVDGRKNGRRWDSKAGIYAACAGAVLGAVGLIVYYVVIKAKGEID